jgi:hypothetical protein
MDEKFADHVEALVPAYEALMASGELPGEKVCGVYLFIEDGKPLYVGRSRDIRRRYGWHCSGDHNQATFAFLLARQQTGYLTASYARGEGSRRWLLEHVPFAAAFSEAKQRIKRMSLHWVKEEDATRQALIEIYCSIALETPYNSFKTT